MSGGLHIVCPDCSSTNRVPADRPAGEGRCGRCGNALFTGRPTVLTEASFDRHLAASQIPVAVDFWAPWCAPCRAMAPAFEEAAAKLEPRVRLAKVNTDDHQKLGGRFSIRGIPTVVIFSGGKEVDRRSGAMDAATLVSWIESNLP